MQPHESLNKRLWEQRLAMIRSQGVSPIDSITNVGFLENKATAVKNWLQGHDAVTDFVIFDDRDNGYHEMFGERFIEIKGRHGLTLRHVAKAIAVLNREEQN